MPLYAGDELVTLNTPDGRQIQVPSSLANAFVGATAAQPAAPMPAPDYASGMNAPGIPQDVTPDSPAPPPQIVTPIEMASPATPEGFENAPVPKAKPAAPAAKPAAPDPYAPVTNAVAEQRDAIADQGLVTISAADQEAASQIQIADELVARNAKIDEMAAARQKQVETDVRAAAQKEGEVQSLQQKFANTKIDRQADHPIMSLMAQLVAAIGMGMAGKFDENPAMKAANDAIDRKVKGQLSDLDKLGTTIGYTKEDAKRLKESMTDNLSRQNLLMSAETERAARAVEAIAARSTSDKIKSNALVFAAGLRERGAALSAEAARGQVEYDQKERFQKDQIDQSNKNRAAENGRFYSGLKQNKEFHDDDLEFKRQQLTLDHDAALAKISAEKGAAAAKAYQEASKDARELGIHNVATAEPLLYQKGYDMMDQAAKYTAEAEKLKGMEQTPEIAKRVGLLEQGAASLRDEAKVNYSLKFGDTTRAREASKQYENIQTLATISDDMKQLYEEADKTGDARTYLSTSGTQAKIQALSTNAAMILKDAWQTGALDKGSIAQLEKAVGKDPTKISVGAIADYVGLKIGEDPRAFQKRLDAINDTLVGQFQTKLTGAGWDVKDPDKRKLIYRKETLNDANSPYAAAQRSAGKNTAIDDANEVAGYGTAKNAVLDAFGTGPSPLTNDREVTRNARVARAEEGSYDAPGLTPEQAKGLDTVLRGAKRGDSKAVGVLVEQMNSSNDSLSAATINAVRANDPDLYAKIKASIPAGTAAGKRIKEIEAMPRVSPGVQLPDRGAPRPQATPQAVQAAAKDVVIAQRATSDLAREAVIGKPDAFSELSRRANSGDPEARKTLEAVINLRARQGGR